MNAPWTTTLGTGFYTVPQAARLLHITPVKIRRWLRGYSFLREDGRTQSMGPLWTPQLPADDHHLELGFKDLIELRFVQRFLEAGLALQTIRNCLEHARECVQDERPFSTRKFKTDGKTIFLESARRAHDTELLNLRNRQYEIKTLIERTFKDLDIEDRAVARWRPLRGKKSIVIDPRRSFGQPIAARYGIPTEALADAADAEGSETSAAKIFEVPVSVIRDAIAFERSLSDA